MKRNALSHRGAWEKALAAMCLVLLAWVSAGEGTWIPLQNQPNEPIEAMLVLSDGTVMAQGGSDAATVDWFRLTPGATGGYTNGTWSSRSPMHYSRLFYGSCVLQSGKVF